MILLPVAIVSLVLDMKASRDHAVLKLDDGEILVPTKPRIQRILAYSLMADCVMLALLSFYLAGYDTVVITNSAVFYGLYLLETSGAKIAVEVYRPELEQFSEIWVEN
ncbi:MAG: hypothetical protein GOV01_02140 [Candidatus Altiarchaeota archaeon]|nr:hypothetical protein [Candidatus Altiarchaeota archaeon]